MADMQEQAPPQAEDNGMQAAVETLAQMFGVEPGQIISVLEREFASQPEQGQSSPLIS